jgi:putative hemolysin
MRKRTLILGFTMAIASLAACGGDDAPTTTDAPVTTDASAAPGGAQIGNPASQYCIDQGGTLEMVDETAGQVGYCNLPDGTRIEEWEYFRASQTPSTTG